MPTIETARLRLRPFSLDDLPTYHKHLFSDADVMRYLPWGRPVPMDETRRVLKAFIDHWDKHGYGIWALADKADNTLIGHCGLNHIEDSGDIELAYALAKTFWGKGIATEAARATLRYAFEQIDLPRVIAVAVPANAASLRVMIKAGMQDKGVGRFYNSDMAFCVMERETYTSDDSLYVLIND